MPLFLVEPEAPRTVRIAALCVAALGILQAIYDAHIAWIGIEINAGAEDRFVQPATVLILGLLWAWGIARLVTNLYWFFIGGSFAAWIMAIVQTVRSWPEKPPWPTWPSPLAQISLRSWGLLNTLEAAFWVAAVALLLTRSSREAFRRRAERRVDAAG